MNDAALQALADDGLYLNLAEMRAIVDYFEEMGRDPTDLELECLAQTWSEHCLHKTFKSPVIINGQRKAPFFSRLKDGARQHFELVVSAFADNSGVMRFYDGWAICGKVETHNSPSAIEPYGGAMTGSGGVFRDILGTGQGAAVIASTDVFCFAPPDLPAEEVPPGLPAAGLPTEEGRRRRAGLRQPHGHSHQQRLGAVPPGLPGQAHRYCRRLRPAARGPGQAGHAAGRRPHPGPGRPHRPRRYPRRHLLVHRHDLRPPSPSTPPPSRSATPWRRSASWTPSWPAATPASSAPSPTAAPAASARPSARWVPSWGPRCTWSGRR